MYEKKSSESLTSFAKGDYAFGSVGLSVYSEQHYSKT